MLPTATVYAYATIGASASRASSTGRLLELLALVWNQTPDSLTGLPYFLSGECVDSKIGLWRVLSQSFPHKAYINLSIPVPALANKANAYLSNLLGVGAFNFFPSESPLSIKKILFGWLSTFLFTKLLHNQSRMSEENVFFFHRARESNFFLYKLQWCEGERAEERAFFYSILSIGFQQSGPTYSIFLFSLRRAF